jgi:excinuclease ABC subunit A
MREDTDVFFNLTFAVEETGESYPEITPQTFAFNTPQGMCPDCMGLGFSWGIDLANVPAIKDLEPKKIVELLWGEQATRLAYKLFSSARLTKSEFFTGTKEDKIIKAELDNVPFRFVWKGVNDAVSEALRHHTDEEPLLPEEWNVTLKENRCLSCNGTRLNALARHVTIHNKSIADLCADSINETKIFINTLPIDAKDDLTLQQVHEELKRRLEFLSRIGLTYLSLNRSAPTLSGGEAQRVRLARQIGSGLTQVLYVLDEPTTGLHPEDCLVLMEALNSLKASGNTLLVVEHDPEVIKHADRVIEFGPGSGKFGGEVTFVGTAAEAMKKTETQPLLPFAKKKKKKKELFLEVKNASVHNLKSLNVKIPLEQLTTLTGVSGCGKSTLLFDVIEKDFRKWKGSEHILDVIVIDQKPMGHTSRSDVASYLDVLTPMRTFFAQLPEARAKGLEPKHFSAYHRKGMCTTCYGMGYKRVEMHFLPAVKIPCPECHGLRLNKLSLSVRYQEKNIGEMLQMTVDELRPLFVNHPRITRLLDMLNSVGLGYLTLGQEMVTLSGGEAQRMKLSYSLSKRPKGRALYLLDEPTTGLHRSEVEKIIRLLHNLVDKGHTVIAIEHNLDLIAASDELIDLGPGAGDKGGTVVAQGSVEDIMKHPTSLTGKFLRQALREI